MPTEPTDGTRSKNPPSNGGGAATAAGMNFQQHVGALVASWMLTGAPFDRAFGLGAARPVWIRFETEAPTDDILVATSEGGYLALQVKTTLSASSEPNSAFAKTVDQFVRHWIACRNGDGALEWNRPLDPSKDRLVIAVGPLASAKVRVHLPAALDGLANAGGGIKTVDQVSAFASFEACVSRSWSNTSTEEMPYELIRQLSALVSVVTVDPSDKELVASLTSFSDHTRSLAIAAILESYCGDQISKRGGFDVTGLRRALITRGADLPSPPDFRSDIEKLRAHSVAVRAQLERYEKVKAGGGTHVGIRRNCQAEVEAAAEAGSLLIIGEPGAGKSGVLNALSKSLADKGGDVIELAVDQFSVDTLEGIANELGLKHSLLEVIEAWDGPGPAWLIVDALDATRGGKGEGAFRALIERVVGMNGRWRVVASIRTFDLRMGRTFRDVFKGRPPSPALVDPEFRGVRHIRVPLWSSEELERLLDLAPAIKVLLGPSNSRLRELATVPFNTRLIGELLDDGLLDQDLSAVQTQAQLLGVYWDHRVTRYGYEAEACLRRVVALMVETRALRASKADLVDAYPRVLQHLVAEGVLIPTESDRWIQFRHHLLFDYVASRVYLGPLFAEIRGATESLQDLGLMLAPAVSFCLQDTWAMEDDRHSFWNLVSHLVADPETDPVIRSVASWMPAELAATEHDAAVLARMLASNHRAAETAVQHFVGALAVRMEDKGTVPVDPWIAVGLSLVRPVGQLAPVARLLCSLLISRASSPDKLDRLGVISRELLQYALANRPNNYLTESSVGFVVDTYETDPTESRRLLTQLFDAAHFDEGGWNSVPALARKIASLARQDPEFASDVYVQTFSKSVVHDRATDLGHSQILPLRSNAKQDYELARYSLAEFFPSFLEAKPALAARALAGALEGFVAREHTRTTEPEVHVVDAAGTRVFLKEDYSHIWAHDPEGGHAEDAEALVAKFLVFMRRAPETQALLATRELMSVNRLALLWARMFMAAAERKDGLADLLWPFAASEPFLLASETRKDAVDLVSAVYDERQTEERLAFETKALRLDFSGFSDAEAARSTVLGRLFGTIGRDRLLTAESRQILDAKSHPASVEVNGRLFATRATWATASPYDWIDQLDESAKPNANLVDAIESFKSSFGLRRGEVHADAIDFAEGVSKIKDLRSLVESEDQAHPDLRRHAIGVIGEAVSKLATRKIASSVMATDALALLDQIEWIGRAEYPELHDDTECKFAESAAWGSPAPRVDATLAALGVLRSFPNFFTRLSPLIEDLLADHHPAVRLQAVGHLTELWEIDRGRFWTLLRGRVIAELNPTVVCQGVCDVLIRVLNADDSLTEDLAFELLSRFCTDCDGDLRVRESVAHILANTWAGYGRARSGEVLSRWLSEPALYRKEVRTAVTELRLIYVYGLYGEEQWNAIEIRHRAQEFLHDTVARLHGLINDALASPESQVSDDVRRYVKLVDDACMQLYFAVDALGADGGNPGSREILLREVGKTMKLIGDVGTPHTIYYLLQLLERFIQIDPGAVFDLISGSLLVGGKRFGYQYEPMGAELLVRLVGLYLADNKEIFEDDVRRRSLVECLEVFMQAGWPSARRLLYRLPELVQ